MKVFIIFIWSNGQAIGPFVACTLTINKRTFSENCSPGAVHFRADSKMPFQLIDNQRLYRQIADQLRALIDSGEFPPGSRLPAERELAKLLGVSRASVREAMIALEVIGLVDVRVGNGVLVCVPPGQAVSDEPGWLLAVCMPAQPSLN